MRRPVVILAALVAIICLHSCSAVTYKLTKDNKTCLIVETVASLRVAYFNTTGQKLVATWSLGEATAISGQCDSETKGQASLNLTFTGYWLQLKFASAGGKASLASIDLSVNLQNGTQFVNPNATGDLLLSGSPALPLSPDTEYFACASALSLPFTSGQPGGSSLGLSATKIQAFGVHNDSMSDKFATCPEDGTTPLPTDSTTPLPTDTTTPLPTNTTSTAAPPATTTSVAPTTAAPEPPLLNFTVYDAATRVPCMRLQLRASLSILYGMKSGGNATVKVALPADSKASGDCGNSSQTVYLTFLQGWRTGLTFVKQSSGGYGLQFLTVDYRLSPDLFPNAAEPNASRSSVGNQTFFSVGSGSGYYTCRSSESLRLDGFVTMDTRDLRAQAFRTNNGTDEFFGTAEQCLDDTPIDNVVPIVVGAALAGLVIIVLIAYLIGRRRHSSGGGYQSV